MRALQSLARGGPAALLAAVLAATPAAPAAAATPAATAWSATFDGGVANNHEPADTAAAGDGTVAVTGRSKTKAGDIDIVTIVYAPNGTRRWVARFDGKVAGDPYPSNWNDIPHNVRFDGAGNVYVTGWTWRGARPGRRYGGGHRPAEVQPGRRAAVEVALQRPRQPR